VSTREATSTRGSETRAIQAANDLGHALVRSPAFRNFEAAQEAFMKADGLRERFDRYQRRRQDLQNARAWGGLDPAVERELDAEWQRLSRMPEVQAYQEAQEELIQLCTQIVAKISAGVGIDFGRACAPAGGCC